MTINDAATADDFARVCNYRDRLQTLACEVDAAGGRVVTDLGDMLTGLLELVEDFVTEFEAGDAGTHRRAKVLLDDFENEVTTMEMCVRDDIAHQATVAG